MRSTKNTRAVTVGIFIFIGLAIFVAGVLTLGGQKKSFVKTIRINAVFKDINGLQKGNNVWFSGVKIGTVRKIAFSGISEVAIEMNIESEARKYIRKDATAKISTDGLIGNKIVVIFGGTTKSPPVEPGDILAVEEALSPDEMMNTLQQNNRNLLEITGDLKLISQRLADGRGSIGKLLKDETLFNNMESLIGVLRKASGNAEQMTADLSAYTSKLQQEGTLANDLITDTTIFNNLQATVTQLKDVSGTAGEIAANLQAMTEKANAKLDDTKSPLGVLLNDKQAAEDLKATLENLRGGTEKLDENMEALQHNFLLRGFFRRKAKAERKN